MEAIYLQSMTDFVLEQYSDHYHSNTPTRILNYASFLKQPLQLWMFVPCDDEGNVLEEPKNDFRGYDDYSKRLNIFEKAKEKVLFEGFEYVKFINDGELSPYHRLIKNDEYFNVRFLDRNIEDLLKEFEYGIELTKTAIKQIQP